MSPGKGPVYYDSESMAGRIPREASVQSQSIAALGQRDSLYLEVTLILMAPKGPPEWSF